MNSAQCLTAIWSSLWEGQLDERRPSCVEAILLRKPRLPQPLLLHVHPLPQALPEDALGEAQLLQVALLGREVPIDGVQLALHVQEHLGLEVLALYLLDLLLVDEFLKSLFGHQVERKVMPVPCLVVLLAWLPERVEVCVYVACELLLVAAQGLDCIPARLPVLSLEVLLHSRGLVPALEAKAGELRLGDPELC